MAMAIPGITWKGFRSAATRELAIQVDASWMRMLPGTMPKEWWLPLVSFIPIDPDVEAVKLPIDMEDLGTFQRLVGPRTAPAPTPLNHILLPRSPWYRDRTIPLADLKRNRFAGWPDRLAGIMLAARRTPGMIFTEMLFAATTTVKTIQGVPLIGTGHKANLRDSSVTFDNLITHSGSTPANMDAAGWEYAQEQMYSRPGPDGTYGLDQEITHVLGGTRMRKKFDKLFKRVIVLEDSANNDAAASVTNIHSTQIEGGVVAIVSSWLDQHPWSRPGGAGAGKDHWWSISTTLMARPFGMLIENGGAPTVDIFDESSEYARLNDHIYIKANMDCNGGAAFPHGITEHRGA